MRKALLPLLLLSLLLLAGCTPGKTPTETTPPTSTADLPSTTPPQDDPLRCDGFSFVIENEEAVITGYLGTGGAVVIPAEAGGAPVRKIQKMAFAYNDTITAVTYPKTMVNTGELAFFQCETLTSVTLPEGMLEISYGSFLRCTALTGVVLPESLIKVGELGFSECSALTSITFPAACATVGSHAFASCGLTEVTFPSTVKNTGIGIFNRCRQLVTASWNTKEVAERAFENCTALKNLNLGDNVERFDYWALDRCTALETLHLGKNQTRFYPGALYGCTSLRELYIPCADFNKINGLALHFVPALTDIYFGGTEAQFKKIVVSEENEGLTQATIHYQYQG